MLAMRAVVPATIFVIFARGRTLAGVVALIRITAAVGLAGSVYAHGLVVCAAIAELLARLSTLAFLP